MENVLDQEIELIANECYPKDEEKRNLLVRRLRVLVVMTLKYFQNELKTTSNTYSLPERIEK